jgi:hypothetical protein
MQKQASSKKQVLATPQTAKTTRLKRQPIRWLRGRV